MARTDLLEGLGRAEGLQIKRGQLNVLLGTGGGDAFGRAEALYRFNPSLSAFGFAEESARTGFTAGLGARLVF